MTLLTDIRVKNIVSEIVEKFFPEKIVLFGSYAHGTPTRDSDVDLLVIMPTQERPLRKAAEISASIEHPLPIDVIVKTPQEIETRLALGDTFISKIIQEGITVHEA
ncbi:MAG: nucleotidyltransferase domain-containing protein [Anaerolineales bacterium]